jgi:perosamine synthetase
MDDKSKIKKPAFLGGAPAVTLDPGDTFTWPIVTPAHEEAVTKVLRSGQMSGLDITREFENRYAKTLGRTYALTCPNGTSAILEAMYAMGIGVGDQVICPSITFWASIIQAFNLGASPIFCDIDPETLCIDPKDIEHRITPQTKAIVVVHYAGMPADMDAILPIARKHKLKILEDCSHAHGGLYKGRPVGTFGDVSAFSLMSGKSFPIGEAGIHFTDDRRIFERALLFGHYVRHNEITLEDLKPFAGLPCGGFKNRLNQFCSALGLVQLDVFPEQMSEIDRAMNLFCDLVEGTPGVGTIRPPKNSGSTKGGWYYPLFHYRKNELGGLSIRRFAEAVTAEGTKCNPGCNRPLHLHPLFYRMDVYGHGRPTRVAHLGSDAGTDGYPEKLPVAESITKKVFEIPWFKKHNREIIEQHAEAYKKVSRDYKLLLKDDYAEDGPDSGGYSSFFREQKNNR